MQGKGRASLFSGPRGKQNSQATESRRALSPRRKVGSGVGLAGEAGAGRVLLPPQVVLGAG